MGEGLNGELGVPPSKADSIDGQANVGPDDGDIPREAGNRAEEVAKEDHDSVELDEEADEGPAHKDEAEAAKEGRGAFELLFAREEEERLLRTDYDCEADEEEDLRSCVS